MALFSVHLPIHLLIALAVLTVPQLCSQLASFQLGCWHCDSSPNPEGIPSGPPAAPHSRPPLEANRAALLHARSLRSQPSLDLCIPFRLRKRVVIMNPWQTVARDLRLAKTSPAARYSSSRGWAEGATQKHAPPSVVARRSGRRNWSGR